MELIIQVICYTHAFRGGVVMLTHKHYTHNDAIVWQNFALLRHYTVNYR